MLGACILFMQFTTIKIADVAKLKLGKTKKIQYFATNS
ncbi:MAG: hypothetical protein K0S75_155 [Clostridia bacterium]|jgi:hypothetical protein|nr:hypothetical protein [Clostridia bacterium]